MLTVYYIYIYLFTVGSELTLHSNDIIHTNTSINSCTKSSSFVHC